jgi:hypothetical protein
VDKAEINEILEERYDSNLEKIAKGGPHAVKVVTELISELEGDDEERTLKAGSGPMEKSGGQLRRSLPNRRRRIVVSISR